MLMGERLFFPGQEVKFVARICCVLQVGHVSGMRELFVCNSVLIQEARPWQRSGKPGGMEPYYGGKLHQKEGIVSTDFECLEFLLAVSVSSISFYFGILDKPCFGVLSFVNKNCAFWIYPL